MRIILVYYIEVVLKKLVFLMETSERTDLTKIFQELERVQFTNGVCDSGKNSQRLLAPRGAKRNPSAVQFWDGFWSLSPRTAGSKGYPNATQKDHFGSTPVHLFFRKMVFGKFLKMVKSEKITILNEKTLAVNLIMKWM